MQLLSRLGHDLMQLAHAVRQLLSLSPTLDAIAQRAVDELRARVLVPLEQHNRRQVDAQLSVRLAPRLAVVPDDALTRSLITAAVKENVGLISRMRERTLQDIEDHVQRYAQGGLRHESLAALLEERFAVSESRARLIGRDQVLKSNSALTQHRQMAAGITHYVWRTSRDEAVRPEHRALDGQVFAWAHPPPIGPPGWDYQCLTGDMLVGCDALIEKAYRRPHSGELAFAVTSSGVRLDGTPNHPVLTSAGMKALKDIDVGDYVISARDYRPRIGELNVKHRHAHVKVVFDLLALTSFGERVPGAASQFHGDGAAENVDIVSANRGLLDGAQASVLQKLSQLILTRADSACFPPEASSRDFLSVLIAMGFPPGSCVRGLSKLLSLEFTRLAHPEQHGISPTSWLQSVALQARNDAGSSECKLFRETLDAFSSDEFTAKSFFVDVFRVWRRSIDNSARRNPSLSELAAKVVSIDAELSGQLRDGIVAGEHQFLRVVEKGVCENFLGHVYNLQTASGWYLANGLVVGNCRCTAEPVLDAQSGSM